MCVLGATAPSLGSEVVRRELEPGVYALARDALTIGLEIRGARRDGSKRILSKYLAIESEWVAYRGRVSSYVPLDRLKAEHQRKVLLAVFKDDLIDEQGWLHTARMDGETLWSLSAWITGNGQNFRQVLAHPQNLGVPTSLKAGQRVLFPVDLLGAAMRQPTPTRIREPQPELAALEESLRYGSDADGEYAIYALAHGESLYSSVVARFTDIRDNDSILEASRIIADRSRIVDMRDIDAGRKIYIPLDLLSARYLPKGNPDREQFEATLRDAERLKGVQGQSRDLSDVVVILDPGHGGDDAGAEYLAAGLYEDEINYDIVCRIRELLKRDTGARVYVTAMDRSSGFSTTDAHRFSHDRDEVLLTTPRHGNADGASVSANLRWMMVNAIFDKEVARGVDDHKIIFTSVHTDSLYNQSLRGAMIYIPGAGYRRQEEIRTDKLYAKYEEGRSNNRFESDAAERRRDEALSLNFARTLLTELGEKRIKRHDQGDPIRSQIRRSRTRVYLPAVLRNTKVPTKVLVETANLKNRTDRERLSDPWWRQQFAVAYVDALKKYYRSDSRATVAQINQAGAGRVGR